MGRPTTAGRRDTTTNHVTATTTTATTTVRMNGIDSGEPEIELSPSTNGALSSTGSIFREELDSPEKNAPKTSKQQKNHDSETPEDDVGSLDQGSTQSSAGDSSDPVLANGTATNKRRNQPQPEPTGISSTGITTTNDALEMSSETGADGGMVMVKQEETVAASSEEAPPSRGFLRTESSRKSVRMLEPSMGSSERMSSSHSLDIDDTEDFLIDTAGMRGGSNGRGRSHRSLDESESSMTHRIFRELIADPSRDGADKRHRSIVWKFRMICGKIVENPHVQLGIIILIIVNAIFMGIATFDFVTDNENVDKGFSSLDKAFLVVFTIELALQLVYRSFSYFTDSWLVFDFVIVITSWSLESLQIVRAFRIFRAFRLVTRIGPLRELVMAIGAVMPRMYAIAMLLMLIFYIFAVLFTELFRDVETEVNYFGSLDRSLFTCMELMTLEWAGVARNVMAERSWAWAPILAFISVTGFIVFNLIVAVVCDAVAVVDREVQAEKMGEFETDTTKLEKAQERIWDMTEHVELMLQSQKELHQVLEKLNTEMEQVTGESTGIVVSRRPSLRRLSVCQ